MSGRSSVGSISVGHAEIAAQQRRRDFFAARPQQRTPIAAAPDGPSPSEIDAVMSKLFGKGWEEMPL